MATRSFTAAQVSTHNKENDCWIILHEKVYDVTPFLKEHPGGKSILIRYGGRDATKEFDGLHQASVLAQYGPKLFVGDLALSAGSDQNGNVVADKKRDRSSSSSSTVVAAGPRVMYTDPYWYAKEMKSPYYTESHRKFRDKVRAFVDKEIIPYCHEWDEKGEYPKELHAKAYEAGVLAAIWPKEYGGTPPEDAKDGRADAFHDLIVVDELARCGAGGILWAVFFSFGIALPPVLKVGSEEMKRTVARDVISGKAIMSLAVTEPYAGSDVAGLQSTAVRDGDYYIVNGEKKYITSGTRATYFTVAVRTGSKGNSGVSLLLIERNRPGVSVRRMKTQGWWISSTAFVAFDNVRVPVKNLIGAENEGFKHIMENFNHERFVLAAMSNRYARVCLEDAIAYARLRKTFNRRLIDHQVIRHKMADMARQIEATHALLEVIAYQMNSNVPDRVLGGLIALAKVQSTKTMEFCAREASQILGGASYIRGGVGERIERLYREVRVQAIGGGSEEVMMDLAMRQAKL